MTLPALQSSDPTAFYSGSLCLSGTGVTRAALQQPDVQTKVKGVIAAVAAEILHTPASADDVFIPSLEGCVINGTTTTLARRLVMCSISVTDRDRIVSSPNVGLTAVDAAGAKRSQCCVRRASGICEGRRHRHYRVCVRDVGGVLLSCLSK